MVIGVVGQLRAESAGLRQHGCDDTIGCPLQKVPNQGTTDAEAHHHELVDPQVIHQTDMVIGIGIPRPIDLERAGGLTAIGVAHVREDAAVFSLELFDRIKRSAAFQAGDRRVQSPPGTSNNGKPGTGLLILNANGAFFVERHGSSSLFSLLTKHSPRCGHHRCGGTLFSVLWRDQQGQA